MSDAEERLREEQRFRGIIERSPDGITLTDEQGLVIEWNNAMEQITGLKAETVLGRPIWDVELELGSKETRTPERREALRAAMGELLKTGQASWLERPLEREVCRPDGSGCFVRGTVFPIETGRGFMLGSISRDVTERRRDQEELRRERDFVSAVLDTVGALVVVLDPEGRIVRFNRCCEQTTGYRSDEVTGQHFWDPFLAADEIEAVKSGFWRFRAGHHPGQHENHWLTKDGNRRHIAWSNTVLTDGAGAVEYIVATGLDVTEQRLAERGRQESEAINQSIIDSSPDCIKLLDLDGRLQFMSEGGRQLLHIQDLSCYLDMPYATFWQGSDHKAAEEAIDRARAGETGRFRGYCPTEDGTPRWWDVAISPVRGAGGKIERLLVVSRDVTEQKEAEEALRASEEKLRTLFEVLPIGISVLDRERRLVQENPALEKILALSQEGLLTGAYAARQYLRSDGRPMAAEEFPSTQALKEQRSAEAEIGVAKEDGTMVWTEVQAVPVSVADWGVVIATTDISARKRAEAALRKAHDEMELRVRQRTTELANTNEELLAEIIERTRVEEELRKAEERLEQRVEERTQELSTLLEISNRVALTLDLEPLLDTILDHLRGVVAYDGATVFKLEDGMLTAVTHRGPTPQASVPKLRFPVEHTPIVRQAISAQRPMIVGDVQRDTPLPQAFFEVAGHLSHPPYGPIRSWMGVPLMVKERAIGFISLGHGEPDHFTPEQANLALTIANQAAVAIENTRLHEQAQALAALEERQRLARELHDAVSQTLFSASLAAEVLPRLWEKDRESGLECLAEVRQLTRGALAEMRTLLLELRPSAVVETELGALLRQLAEAVTSRARVPVTVQAAAPCVVPPDVQVALYRIAQEALNNVVKHAQARKVELTLQCVSSEAGAASEVELCVADDGRGFDPTGLPGRSKGMGLGIMRERAEAVGAAFDIESGSGRGTRLTVVWAADDR